MSEEVLDGYIVVTVSFRVAGKTDLKGFRETVNEFINNVMKKHNMLMSGMNIVYRPLKRGDAR